MTDFSVNLNTGYVQGQTQSSGKTQTIAKDSQFNSYDQFTIWQSSEQKAVEENTLQEIASVGDSFNQEEWDEAFEANYKKALNNAGSFSFMQEGKNYSESLQELSQNNLDSYDTIEKDGKITLDEFKQREILENNTFAGTEGDKISEDDELAMQMLETTFKFMDLNGDNAIDIDEIKAYYTVADIMDCTDNEAKEVDDTMDGVITFASVDEMQQAMAFEGEPYSKEYESRNTLKISMTQIYENITGEKAANDTPANDNTKPENNEGNTQKTTGKPVELPFHQANEPSAKGKIIKSIEDSFFN